MFAALSCLLSSFNRLFLKPPSKGAALAFFVAIAVLLRFFTFFPNVIDHDESTYIVIASEMLQGELLYVDLIDIKPPGIFLLFALQLWLYKSIFFIRFMAAVAVGISAFGLYAIKLRERGDFRVAIAGGLIYLLMTGIFKNYGVSVNTELYFNLFTIWGLYWFQKGRLEDYGIGGLLMGCGFIVKYVVLFDFAAFMLLGLFILNGDKSLSGLARLLPRIGLAVAGLLLPFGLIYLYYRLSGHADAFYFITRVAPQQYVKSFNPANMALLAGDFFLRYAPISFMAVQAFRFTRQATERRFAGIWLLLGLVAVILPGNRFFHYTIQLMPPVAWLAAIYFAPEIPRPRWVTFQRLAAIGVAGLALIMVLHCKNYFLPQDRTREVAQYLNGRIQQKEGLYVANSHQVYYFLTQKNCPTPYVHNTLLFDPRHLAVLGIDSTRHWQYIMDQAPAYVLETDSLPSSYIARRLSTDYQMQTKIGPVKVWARKPD